VAGRPNRRGAKSPPLKGQLEGDRRAQFDDLARPQNQKDFLASRSRKGIRDPHDQGGRFRWERIIHEDHVVAEAKPTAHKLLVSPWPHDAAAMRAEYRPHPFNA